MEEELKALVLLQENPQTRVKQQLLVKQVSKGLCFSKKIDFIWLYFYGLYCYAIKKEQTLEIEQKRKCLEMLWTDGQRRFLRETLGLFLTSYTRYRSGYSSASLKKWELHQQGRLTSQYRLENKCY